MSIATLQIVNNSLAALTARLDAAEKRIVDLEMLVKYPPHVVEVVDVADKMVSTKPKPILTLKRGVVA